MLMEGRKVVNTKKGNTVIVSIIIILVIGLSLIFFITHNKNKKSTEKNIVKTDKEYITEKAVTENLIAEGNKKYQVYCAACHGEKGDGKGVLSRFTYPKPRDFTFGVFKLRSTPSGSVPTDEDLEKTIKNGMLGTGMPSFAFLNDIEITSIIQYIKGFAVKCVGEKCIKFFEARKSSPIELPSKMEKTEPLLALGESFYKEVQCGKCHGDSGKGDGDGVEDLKDRWGYPIKVRDFTKGEYLGGNSETDLLKRFLTGMDGSPMPSFIDSIKEMADKDPEKQKQFLWGLVYYVKSLERKDMKIANPPKNSTIYANIVSNGFNFDINAKDWETATTYEIPLNRLWQIDENYKIAYLKVLYNNHKIGFLVEWEDKTPDYHNFKVRQFQDMIALQFASEEKPPFLSMGDKEHPVNIWLYKPDKQENTVNTISVYTNTANDLPITVPNDENIFYTSRAAGNLIMPDTNTPSPIEDLNAIGAETITSQPKEEQNVTGYGRWKNGKWQVLFIRDISTSYKWDIQLTKGKKIPIAIAIWDGAKGDRNGQKLISTWYYLIVQ